MPAFAERRFGKEDEAIDRFATAYGYDLRTWEHFAVLREMRDVSTLTALIRLAPSQEGSARELQFRLRTLRAGDVEAIWRAQ